MKDIVPRTHVKVIIGLGNPGLRYYKTRHSIGFRIVDTLVKQCDETWYDNGIMQTATIVVNDRPILIVKSNTYMNDSGKVVPFILKKGIKPEEIMVVHDELEKPFGTLAFKLNGSHRGHNGLRSIIAICGGDFYRLRIGIGRPAQKEDVPTYVLEPFDCVTSAVNTMIDNAVELLLNTL